MYICCSDNPSSTVLRLFIETTTFFVVLSRVYHQECTITSVASTVRSDQGGENVKVARYILNHPRLEPARRSMITGRSVHNQRIERLWREVFTCVLSLYYSLFTHLEECGVLNPNDNVDLFCLHHIYIPRIKSFEDLALRLE